MTMAAGYPVAESEFAAFSVDMSPPAGSKVIRRAAKIAIASNSPDVASQMPAVNALLSGLPRAQRAVYLVWPGTPFWYRDPVTGLAIYNGSSADLPDQRPVMLEALKNGVLDLGAYPDRIYGNTDALTNVQRLAVAGAAFNGYSPKGLGTVITEGPTEYALYGKDVARLARREPSYQARIDAVCDRLGWPRLNWAALAAETFSADGSTITDLTVPELTYSMEIAQASVQKCLIDAGWFTLADLESGATRLVIFNAGYGVVDQTRTTTGWATYVPRTIARCPSAYLLQLRVSKANGTILADQTVPVLETQGREIIKGFAKSDGTLLGDPFLKVNFDGAETGGLTTAEQLAATKRLVRSIVTAGHRGCVFWCGGGANDNAAHTAVLSDMDVILQEELPATRTARRSSMGIAFDTSSYAEAVAASDPVVNLRLGKSTIDVKVGAPSAAYVGTVTNGIESNIFAEPLVADNVGTRITNPTSTVSNYIATGTNFGTVGSEFYPSAGPAKNFSVTVRFQVLASGTLRAYLLSNQDAAGSFQIVLSARGFAQDANYCSLWMKRDNSNYLLLSVLTAGAHADGGWHTLTVHFDCLTMAMSLIFDGGVAIGTTAQPNDSTLNPITVATSRTPPSTSGVALSIDGPTKVITRATGSFVSDGWAVGDVMMPSLANAQNNVRSTITAVTATTMTLWNQAEMVTETSATGKSLALDGISVLKANPNFNTQFHIGAANSGTGNGTSQLAATDLVVSELLVLQGPTQLVTGYPAAASPVQGTIASLSTRALGFDGRVLYNGAAVRNFYVRARTQHGALLLFADSQTTQGKERRAWIGGFNVAFKDAMSVAGTWSAAMIGHQGSYVISYDGISRGGIANGTAYASWPSALKLLIPDSAIAVTDPGTLGASNPSTTNTSAVGLVGGAWFLADGSSVTNTNGSTWTWTVAEASFDVTAPLALRLKCIGSTTGSGSGVMRVVLKNGSDVLCSTTINCKGPVPAGGRAAGIVDLGGGVYEFPVVIPIPAGIRGSATYSLFAAHNGAEGTGGSTGPCGIRGAEVTLATPVGVSTGVLIAEGGRSMRWLLRQLESIGDNRVAEILLAAAHPAISSGQVPNIKVLIAQGLNDSNDPNTSMTVSQFTAGPSNGFNGLASNFEWLMQLLDRAAAINGWTSSNICAEMTYLPSNADVLHMHRAYGAALRVSQLRQADPTKVQMAVLATPEALSYATVNGRGGFPDGIHASRWLYEAFSRLCVSENQAAVERVVGQTDAGGAAASKPLVVLTHVRR